MTRRVLDIGCGPNKVPGATGMDRMPMPGVDVVHDLNARPYPFDDNAFDEIHARHVLEHVDDMIGVMEELHRIARPGGKIYVAGPYYASADAFRDPTHRRAFTEQSFDYFTEESPLNFYTRARFRILSTEYTDEDPIGKADFPRRRLGKLLLVMIRSLPPDVRRKLFINTTSEIRFTLEAVKDA